MLFPCVESTTCRGLPVLCDPGLAPTFSDDINDIGTVHVNGVCYVLPQD